MFGWCLELGIEPFITWKFPLTSVLPAAELVECLDDNKQCTQFDLSEKIYNRLPFHSFISG